MTHARCPALLLLLLALPAAARPSAHLDVFYIPRAGSEVSNPVFLEKGDGDGYGLRLRLAPTPRFFLQLEGQRNTYDSDTTDVEGKAIRAGVGASFFARKRLKAYGHLEALRVDFHDRLSDQSLIEEDGLALHAGVLLVPLDPLTLHAQAGLLELEDSDGHELQAGAALQVDAHAAAFLEYRLSTVESLRGLGIPGRIDYEFDEIRLGVRFLFGRGH